MQQTLSNEPARNEAVKPAGPASLDLNFVAAVDLRLHCCGAVAQGEGADTVKPCGPSDTPLGILQNVPNAGEQAIVRVLGVSLARIAGPVTKGQKLTPAADETGALVAADHRSPPYHVVAQALCDATDGADVVYVAVVRAYIPESIAPAALTLAARCPHCGEKIGIA